ncbi:MAG: PKD domain-containing protein, partial [Methanomicrobiales archaeon]|nr:PKD domain-containing protein [Methanomicrobiales archaeon]
MTGLKPIALVSTVIVIWLLLPSAQAVGPAQGDLVHICTVSGAQERPDIDGNRVVWEDSRSEGRYIYHSSTSGGGGQRVTTEDLEHADQRYPSISGDFIVWQDRRHGNSEIYLFSHSSGERRITNSTTDQQMPVICGDHVVWYDTRRGGFDICLYNIATGEETYLDCSPVTQWRPALSDDYVVWEEDSGGGDIWIYGIQTREKRAITQNGARQTYPAISGRLIAWEDYRSGWPDIYIFDLDADREQKISDNPAAQVSPAISGDVLVWEDKRSGTWEIYVCDLALHAGIQIPLAPTGREQIYPAISDERIVWQNDRDGQSDIYAFAYARGMPPRVDFSAEPGAGTVPLTVSFRDHSSSSPDTWEWDFGDGVIWTQQNPLYTYDEPGEYTVSLTASNRFGSDTVTKIALINATPPTEAPVIHFSAPESRGTAPFKVLFSDESSGGPTAWLWDFGDGGSSADQNAEHIYTEPGTYDVTLTCSNLAGSATHTRHGYITVLEPLKADFSANVTEGRKPLSVAFSDRSSGSPTSWEWDFGDGRSSREQGPTHIYQDAGTYTVRLTVSGDAGRDVSEKIGYIRVTALTPVVAGFSASATEGRAPLTVRFSDGSKGDPESWSWTFGDGGASNEQNPIHVYQKPGRYTVSLSVAGDAGKDTATRNGYITVLEPLTANFTTNVTGGPAPLAVRFLDASSGEPTSWLWDFGDKTTSNEQNPVHTYTTAGNYTVNLTVGGAAGNTSVVREGYLSVGPAPATPAPPRPSSGGGGGGGGGGTSAPPGQEWTTGPVQTDTAVPGGDHDHGDRSFGIASPGGTIRLIVVGSAGGPDIAEVSIMAPGPGDIPLAPDAHTFTGHACTIGPGETVFASLVTLAFNLTAEEWTAVSSGEDGPAVQHYNQSTETWEEIPIYLHQ